MIKILTNKKFIFIVPLLVVFLFSFSSAFAACGDNITGGIGTIGDPYQINDPTELAAISSCLGSGNSSKYFKLMNDIDLNVSPYNTGVGWSPIGTSSGSSSFYGKFDGNYKTIYNLFINSSSSSVGLFGHISSGSIIESITLDTINVTGGNSDVGALVGTSYGTVRNSAVRTGTLSGLMRLGALIGSNTSTGVVQRSFSDNVTVTQRASTNQCCVGGLTGATEFGGSMSDSYARNSVIHTSGGQGVFGGTIGSTYLATSVARIYSTGSVSTLSSYPAQVGGLTGNSGVTPTSSYWDTQTSSQATSGSGTGKTTIQMQDQSTYTGWDFDTVWNIDGVNNGGYPYLRWQNLADVAAPIVSTFSPVDNATSVATNANLIITFSETVDVETGNITIKKTSDDSTVETIDVTSGQVTGTGTNVITINPSVELISSTEYYVLIDATAFDDTFGNSYAGISSSTVWSFTVIDTTVPVITLTGSPSVSINQGSTYSDSGATALDDLDGDITGNIVTTNNVNINTPGTYTVSYNVVDTASNNAITVSRAVTVNSIGGSVSIVLLQNLSDQLRNKQTNEIVHTPVFISNTNTNQNNKEILQDCAPGHLFSMVTGKHCNKNNVSNIDNSTTPNETNNINQITEKFTKNLEFNMDNEEEIRELQKFLNKTGFTVAFSGPGSIGNETNYFGYATRSAVIKYQKAKNINPAVGYFGPLTRASVNSF